jgi:hypothetical protein
MVIVEMVVDLDAIGKWYHEIPLLTRLDNRPAQPSRGRSDGGA